MFRDGTKLVTIHEPIRPREGAAEDGLEPGALLPLEGDIELNAGRDRIEVTAVNTGDRAIQIGSHFHFFEVNRALEFDRSKAFGRRLDIPAGTAVRFEPGQSKKLVLVAFGGERRISGFNNLCDDAADAGEALRRAREGGFKGA